MTPDLDLFRSAERLEWHAATVFDGDQPGGDGNIDGELRAISGAEVVASVPLDIFTPGAWDGDPSVWGDPSAGWVVGEKGPLGLIIADPRTRDAVHDEIRRWCHREFGRDDVRVTL